MELHSSAHAFFDIRPPRTLLWPSTDPPPLEPYGSIPPYCLHETAIFGAIVLLHHLLSDSLSALIDSEKYTTLAA